MVMKRSLITGMAASVIVCLIGAGLLIGSAVYAARLRESHKDHPIDFSTYSTKSTDGYFPPGVGHVINYPSFLKTDQIENWNYYLEVDHAVSDYISHIETKYKYDAAVDFTVDHTGTTLTIELFGTGYPEYGEPEPLSRTYIFDLAGVDEGKLPRLVNRAEFIGY